MSNLALLRNMTAEEALTEIPYLIGDLQLPAATAAYLQELFEIVSDKVKTDAYQNGYYRLRNAL